MAQALSGAADVLRAAGLTVVEMPGWADRGESDGGFDPHGLILHHDAMGLGWNSDPTDDNNVPQYMDQNGVDGAQFWVRRDGVWFTLAAGRKWHAGLGQWRSIPTDSGNTLTAGVETDHTIGNPWPAVHVDAINRGCRALVQHYGWNVDQYCCGHREYAPTRKIDPENFDLDAWRTYLKGADTTTVTSTGTGTTSTGELTMTPDVQAAFDAIPGKVWGSKNVTITGADGKAVVIPAATALQLSVVMIGHTRDALAALSGALKAAKVTR